MGPTRPWGSRPSPFGEEKGKEEGAQCARHSGLLPVASAFARSALRLRLLAQKKTNLLLFPLNSPSYHSAWPESTYLHYAPTMSVTGVGGASSERETAFESRCCARFLFRRSSPPRALKMRPEQRRVGTPERPFADGRHPASAVFALPPVGVDSSSSLPMLAPSCPYHRVDTTPWPQDGSGDRRPACAGGGRGPRDRGPRVLPHQWAGGLDPTGARD